MSKQSPALWMKFWWRKWFRLNQHLPNMRTNMKSKNEIHCRSDLFLLFPLKTGPKFHFREMKLFAAGGTKFPIPVVFFCFSQNFNSVQMFFHPFRGRQFFQSFDFFFIFLFNPAVNLNICHRLPIFIHFSLGKRKNLGKNKCVFLTFLFLIFHPAVKNQS